MESYFERFDRLRDALRAIMLSAKSMGAEWVVGKAFAALAEDAKHNAPKEPT